MTQTIEATKPDALATSPATPIELLHIAVSQNADIDKLTKLMDLQERWEKNEARKAFVVAMNAFKADPPSIVKNKHVKSGTTEYDHATLDQVCDGVTKGLSQHQISHRWVIDQGTFGIKVTCVLTHSQGHSEETTLLGTADTSGSKNGIQAIGSTVTYLQRYTLMAACGLAASNGGDDDGKSSSSLTNGWVDEHCEWLTNCKDRAELEKLFKSYYSEASAAKDKMAQAALIQAKDARKKEL